MSSSVVSLRKSSLLVFFTLAFFFAISSVLSDRPVFSDSFGNFENANIQNREYSAKSGRAAPGQPSGPVDNLLNVLEENGLLNIVNNLVPAFEDMIKGAEGLFEFTDKQHHAAHLNKILGHLKGTWSRAIDRSMQQQGKSSEDSVDPKSFNSFVDTYKNLFAEAVKKDESLKNSDVVQFLHLMDHFFITLESTYAAIFFGLEELHIPIKPNWQLLVMSKFLVLAIPTNILDAQTLNQFMSAPRLMIEEVSKMIQEFFDQIRDTQYGMYVPLAVQFLENSTKYLRQKQSHFENHMEV